MKIFRFRALVTLAGTGLAGTGLAGQAGQYPCGTHSLMVRCPRRDNPARERYFPAAIYRQDEQPMRPGDPAMDVTIAVADDQAREYLGPGQRFTLWNGHDIGHGVISRQVFFTWVA